MATVGVKGLTSVHYATENKRTSTERRCIKVCSRRNWRWDTRLIVFHLVTYCVVRTIPTVISTRIGSTRQTSTDWERKTDRQAMISNRRMRYHNSMPFLFLFYLQSPGYYVTDYSSFRI